MVNGVESVRAMFRRKAAAVAKAGQVAAKAGAEDVAKAARFLAPKDERELIASIRVEDANTRKTSKGTTGFIGALVKAGDETTVVTNARGQRFQNAKLQEAGTKHRDANPYFNPAWRASRSRIRAKISRDVRKAWKDG